MSRRVFTHAERPDLAERAAATADDVWPEYIRHGDVINRWWRRMRLEFPELQLVLYDDERDDIVAEAHTLAIAWDGSLADLPAGFDGIFERAFAGGDKNALCAMAAEIWPAHRGGGLATTLLELMGELARTRGLSDVLAAVRPSWKGRHPLVPIEEYAAWTRDDGLPYDPWLRVHVRLGGEILRPEPHSSLISGTREDWEEWTGVAFPEDGEVVFPEGLAPARVSGGRVVYHEPNVWVRHRVAPPAAT